MQIVFPTLAPVKMNQIFKGVLEPIVKVMVVNGVSLPMLVLVIAT